jgi:hypothetical protein
MNNVEQLFDDLKTYLSPKDMSYYMRKDKKLDKLFNDITNQQINFCFEKAGLLKT